MSKDSSVLLVLLLVVIGNLVCLDYNINTQNAFDPEEKGL
ncbi:MAG: hypothetical protein KatS3mg006_1686 [Pyrinomonadaceae bacterium]|jgi:hypothetical protein|nr:MAG: hypothetical protein KatS3mg006_1686 [Pyrinomonadaceae bacterium]